MDNKKLEYIILYGLIGCTILALSATVRLFALRLGFDGFSANITFVVTVVTVSVIYLSIHVLLQSALVPMISKLLLKIPYFREQQKTEKNTLDTIREEHRQKQLEQNNQLLDTALQYIRTTFAPYAVDGEIDRLCEYITCYSASGELKSVKPIRTKELQSIDLFHLGWNLWNHFKPARRNKQEDIAIFLKSVFANNLKDVETETIKKKLTFNEGKCKIKLIQKLISP